MASRRLKSLIGRVKKSEPGFTGFVDYRDFHDILDRAFFSSFEELAWWIRKESKKAKKVTIFLTFA